MVKRFTKTNSEILDYSFDFAPSSAWLESGETLQSQQVVTSPASELGVTSITNTGSSVMCFIGSGIADSVYTVTCLVGTTKGRQAARSFEIGVVSSR